MQRLAGAIADPSLQATERAQAPVPIAHALTPGPAPGPPIRALLIACAIALASALLTFYLLS